MSGITIIYTVQPGLVDTSIKRAPPLSGHFRNPLTISNANTPIKHAPVKRG